MSARLPAPPVLRRLALALLFLVPLVAVTPDVGAQDDVVVTMVTDTAGLGDQNFNDLAKRGLDRASAELGVEQRVIESANQAKYVPNLTAGAEQSDLTVGVGFLLTEAMQAIADQFPDEKFAIIDADAERDNVASFLFKEQEGAFLAGVVAGLMTETNRLGVVGGIEIPPVVRYAVGFEAGARSVNPDVEVVVAYADTFDDPALGRELTLAQYNEGADIVFPVAGKTGVGSFDAAKEKGEGFWVIAADTDQSQLGAEHQLAVATKGVDTAMFSVAEQVANDEFEGGLQVLGLAENGVGLETPGNFVPDDVLAVVDQYRQAIITGAVVVPTTDEELAAFQPTTPEALGSPAAASPAAASPTAASPAAGTPTA